MSANHFGMESLRWFQCNKCESKLPCTGGPEIREIWCSRCQEFKLVARLIEITAVEE